MAFQVRPHSLPLNSNYAIRVTTLHARARSLFFTAIAQPKTWSKVREHETGKFRADEREE